ncbi:hypothetical protein [Streptomyces sp. CT34]|uniref:hypothetical protein n=1 Tax=Streptomyces sp. CT34 TaxID=1553907 RepID=UPI0005BC669A|nr:hypothetical protein [Streptomyces sp. CT34]
MIDPLLHQTIENLESALPELEAQEKQLRGELNDVVQRVTSARHALEHLRVLTGAAAPVEQPAPTTVETDAAAAAPASVEPAGHGAGQDSPGLDAPAAPEPVAEPAGAAAATVPSPRAATPRAKAATAKKRTAKKATAKKAAVPATARARKAASKKAAPARSAAEGAGGLLEAALKVLQKANGPLRAREINEALGREATPGQIESVRNTLDRVAKQQKLVTRPGRGTYAAL